MLTLPYEWLRSDPAGFVNRIRSFVELPQTDRIPRGQVNVGMSAATCRIKRWLNRALASPNRPGALSRPERWAAIFASRLDRYIPDAVRSASERALSRKIDQLVAGVYAESNEKTSILTGLNLASLGYEMPSRNHSR